MADTNSNLRREQCETTRSGYRLDRRTRGRSTRNYDSRSNPRSDPGNSLIRRVQQCRPQPRTRASRRNCACAGVREARRRGWKFYVLVGVGIPFADPAPSSSIYFYISFSRMIDARLRGEMQRADPRVFARPFELRRGQSLTPTAAHRPAQRPRLLPPRANAEQPGEFTVGRDAVRHDPARRRPQGPARPYRVRRARAQRARSRRRSITSSSWRRSRPSIG